MPSELSDRPFEELLEFGKVRPSGLNTTRLSGEKSGATQNNTAKVTVRPKDALHAALDGFKPFLESV
jgi:hypothetical protein